MRKVNKRYIHVYLYIRYVQVCVCEALENENAAVNPLNAVVHANERTKM